MDKYKESVLAQKTAMEDSLSSQKTKLDSVNSTLSSYSDRLKGIAKIDLTNKYGSGTEKFVSKKLKELGVTREEYDVE